MSIPSFAVLDSGECISPIYAGTVELKLFRLVAIAKTLFVLLNLYVGFKLGQRSASATSVDEEEVEADSQSDAKQSTPPLPPSDASTSSLPELVSNDSSSSPPNDPPPQDELAQPIALTGEPLVTSDTAGPGSLHGFDGTLVVGKEIEKVTVSEKGKGRAIEPVTEDVSLYPLFNDASSYD